MKEEKENNTSETRSGISYNWLIAIIQATMLISGFIGVYVSVSSKIAVLGNKIDNMEKNMEKVEANIREDIKRLEVRVDQNSKKVEEINSRLTTIEAKIEDKE